MSNAATHRYSVNSVSIDGSRHSFCPAKDCWVTGTVELMTGPQADEVLARMLAKGDDAEYFITDQIVAREICKIRRAAEARVLEQYGYDDLPYEVRKNAVHIRMEAQGAGDAAVKAAGYSTAGSR